MSIPYAPLSNHCLPQHEACAWHSPTAPTIVMTAQGPKVLLWIKAQPWPQEVLLRCEPDNEEWLLQMTLQTESAGWRGYCADLPLHQASSRHFYCFKLLWRHAQCWFGPEGWSLQPPERLRQFCLALPIRTPTGYQTRSSTRSSLTASPRAAVTIWYRRGNINIMPATVGFGVAPGISHSS